MAATVEDIDLGAKAGMELVFVVVVISASSRHSSIER
jgi:hypothetical protein